MNASTLPTALGLVLARKCGVTLPELDPAIERVTRTLVGCAGLGTFNYFVEGEPNSKSNEDNGKSSLGAIVFAMHNDRVDEARFMANLAVTGQTFTTRPELVLGNSEIAAAALSNDYDATNRTTAELMQDLLFELTRTSDLASKELAARPADAAAQVPTLIARAADPASPGRTGACRALGEIRDDAAVPTLLGLLTDADEDVRYRAAEALIKFPAALLRKNINCRTSR